MNHKRIVAAAAMATVVYFAYGFVVHGLLLAEGYVAFPAGAYRTASESARRMPLGMLAIFVALLVFAFLHARLNGPRQEPGRGIRLGALFGVFVAAAFVGANYSTLEIGGVLALEQAFSAIVEWTLIGAVVGWVYKGSSQPVEQSAASRSRQSGGPSRP